MKKLVASFDATVSRNLIHLAIIQESQASGSVPNLLVHEIGADKTRVSGLAQDIMNFIGRIAAHGNDGLISVKRT